MRGRPDRHRNHIADDRERALPLPGGEAADRDHGGEVVEPDDGMAQPREQSVREAHGHLVIHDVMGERRPGHGRKSGDESKYPHDDLRNGRGG